MLKQMRLLTAFILVVVLTGLTKVNILNAYYDHDYDRYGYGQYGQPYNPEVLGDPVNVGTDIWHGLVSGPSIDNYEQKNNAIQEEEEQLRMKDYDIQR